MFLMASNLKKSLLLVVAGILIGLLHQFASMKEWEEATVDLRLQYRPKTTTSGSVGIIAVGDEDVEYRTFGGWPFSRTIHADVVSILRALGAPQITFDVIFSDPDKSGHDETFANILAEKNDVTLAYHFENLQVSEVSSAIGENHFAEGNRYGVDVRDSLAFAGEDPVPPVFETVGFGAVNFQPEANNGSVRRIPLFIQYRGKLYPSLAMETLIRYLELDPDQIQIIPGKQIALIDTPKGNFEIPVDERLQYRVNYTSDSTDFEPAFQYLDLYRAVDDPEQAAIISKAISGKPVIIGNASTGTSDIVSTPIGRLYGMLAQATVISNILDRNHLKFLHPWTQVAGLGVFGLLLGLLFRLQSPVAIIFSVIFFSSIYLVGAYFFAVKNWMIPVLPVLELSALAMISSLWSQVIQAKDETGRTLRTLKKYVSPSVAERALREETYRKIETERREITVFFSDIRGFTDWSERKEPEEITMVLNEYLEAMTQLVNEFGGTLDKFVGDCVMVLFNAPEETENHAVRAVEMAFAMQDRIRELSESWSARGQDPIEVGMGINTGFATVGNFGSEIYSDYTAIGNCVNLAARIESESKPGEILVSEAMKGRLGRAFSAKDCGKRTLKGISEPVQVFLVERN